MLGSRSCSPIRLSHVEFDVDDFGTGGRRAVPHMDQVDGANTPNTAVPGLLLAGSQASYRAKVRRCPSEPKAMTS